MHSEQRSLTVDEAVDDSEGIVDALRRLGFKTIDASALDTSGASEVETSETSDGADGRRLQSRGGVKCPGGQSELRWERFQRLNSSPRGERLNSPPRGERLNTPPRGERLNTPPRGERLNSPPRGASPRAPKLPKLPKFWTPWGLQKWREMQQPAPVGSAQRLSVAAGGAGAGLVVGVLIAVGLISRRRRTFRGMPNTASRTKVGVGIS